MPNTRFAKVLRELGCSRSTPAAPHKAASLSQEVTLWARVLSQCRVKHILSVPVSTSQPHQMRVCHTLRRTIVAHCASRHEEAPESVLDVSIVHLSRPILEAVRPRLAIVLLL